MMEYRTIDKLMRKVKNRTTSDSVGDLSDLLEGLPVYKQRAVRSYADEYKVCLKRREDGSLQEDLHEHYSANRSTFYSSKYFMTGLGSFLGAVAGAIISPPLFGPLWGLVFGGFGGLSFEWLFHPCAKYRGATDRSGIRGSKGYMRNRERELSSILSEEEKYDARSKKNKEPPRDPPKAPPKEVEPEIIAS